MKIKTSQKSKASTGKNHSAKGVKQTVTGHGNFQTGGKRMPAHSTHGKTSKRHG